MIWIFATLCTALIVYEFVALYRSRGETISEIFWRLSRPH
jgi:hypothetical protein